MDHIINRLESFLLICELIKVILGYQLNRIKTFILQEQLVLKLYLQLNPDLYYLQENSSKIYLKVYLRYIKVYLRYILAVIF